MLQLNKTKPGLMFVDDPSLHTLKRRRFEIIDSMEASSSAQAKLADMREKLGREIRVFETSGVEIRLVWDFEITGFSEEELEISIYPGALPHIRAEPDPELIPDLRGQFFLLRRKLRSLSSSKIRLLYILWDFENMSIRSGAHIAKFIRGLIQLLECNGFEGVLALEAVVGDSKTKKTKKSKTIQDRMRYALMASGIPVFEAGSDAENAADEEIIKRINKWFSICNDGLAAVISSDHFYAATFNELMCHPNIDTMLLYDPDSIGKNLDFYPTPCLEFTCVEVRSVMKLAASEHLRHRDIGLSSAKSRLKVARRPWSPVCRSISSNILWAPYDIKTFETVWPFQPTIPSIPLSIPLPPDVTSTGQANLEGDQKESDGDSDNSSVDLEEVDDAVESHQPSGDDTDDEEEEVDNNKPSESDALEKDAVNFEEEADVARKVLKNLLASSKGSIASHDGQAAFEDSKDAGMDAVQRCLMFEDECILVDATDKVVGHDSKYNCHLMENIEAKNLLHRAFSVFLFNSKYELLLQQRSNTKVTFPLVWTNTCCSHPLYRESELIQENALGVRNAAQRKLFDELGIVAEDVPVDEFTALGRMLYKAPSDGKWGEHELDYLLFIVRDVKVQPNPEEVADIKYVSREELKELVKKADAGEEGLKLSPWFRLVVDNFLMKWWDHVEKGTLSEAVDMKTIHKL